MFFCCCLCVQLQIELLQTESSQDASVVSDTSSRVVDNTSGVTGPRTIAEPTRSANGVDQVCSPRPHLRDHHQRASHQTVHILFLANDRCLRDYDINCRALLIIVLVRPNFVTC